MPAVSQKKYDADMALVNERLAKLEEGHRSEWAAEAKAAEAEEVNEVVALYGTKTGKILLDNGFVTVAQVEGASDETLLGISGIKDATLEKIREAKKTEG